MSTSHSRGEAEPDPVELARCALSLISRSRADDRDSWLKVGMALHATSVALLPEWTEWSRQSSKFEEGECERQWRSFQPDKARSVSVGTLVRMAREDSGDASFGRRAPPGNGTLSFASLDAAIETLAAETGGKPSGTWFYEQIDGGPAMWIVRLDLRGLDRHHKQKKTFRPIRPVGDRFAIGDPEGLLCIYGLTSLKSATRVFVVEGEKTAEAGSEIGLVTTTSAHGSSSAKRSDWSPLAGREVVILPDHDQGGERYAADVARLLGQLVPPATVRIVELPGLDAGHDLVDYVRTQRAAGKSDHEIHLAIEALVDAARPCAGNGGGLDGAPQEFPEPAPLPDTRPPVAAFDPSFLPDRLGPWVADIAERMQCAADFVFAAAIVGLSALLGRKLGIRPKREDVWLVVANLWGGGIGRPSQLKSPAMKEALKPLVQLELEAKERFERDKAAFDVGEILREARRAEHGRDLRAAIRRGDDGEAIAAEIAADALLEPVRMRLIVNDSTVEKLGEILAEKPNGVLCFRDELVGLLRSLDKEGQEGARAFYLQAWNGDGRYTYDRIERGTIEIEAAIVSMFGGIQPGPLSQYLQAAAAGGKGDDGLIQRFQILVFPDPPKTWKNHDRRPDARAREAAYEVFRRIAELTPESVGAEVDPDEPDGIPFLHFNGPAQERFDRWRERLERYLCTAEDAETYEAHLGKYRSLVPSLALIYHLADGGVGAVGLRPLERAIATADYLDSHARRIYAQMLMPELAAARALAAKIVAKQTKNPFTARDIYQHGWSGLGNKASVEQAIGVLCDLDWLIPERIDTTGGAPKNAYRINPRVWDLPDRATCTTGTTWSEKAAEPTERGPKGCSQPEAEAPQSQAPLGGVSPEPLDPPRRTPKTEALFEDTDPWQVHDA